MRQLTPENNGILSLALRHPIQSALAALVAVQAGGIGLQNWSGRDIPFIVMEPSIAVTDTREEKAKNAITPDQLREAESSSDKMRQLGRKSNVLELDTPKTQETQLVKIALPDGTVKETRLPISCGELKVWGFADADGVQMMELGYLNKNATSGCTSVLPSKRPDPVK